MNQKATSIPTRSFWISVSSCVRQLLDEGSQRVSAARAAGVKKRTNTKTRSQGRKLGNMGGRSASAVPACVDDSPCRTPVEVEPAYHSYPARLPTIGTTADRRCQCSHGICGRTDVDA